MLDSFQARKPKGSSSAISTLFFVQRIGDLTKWMKDGNERVSHPRNRRTVQFCMVSAKEAFGRLGIIFFAMP
jgi:hypothetical protein